MRTQRNKYAYYKKGIIGEIWNKIYPAYFFDKIRDINVNSKILDVGCGYGRLIKSFKAIGFDNVRGIDPFLDEDLTKDNIFKKTIFEVSDKFDVIIFKNSFEHISNQMETLQKVFDILKDNGFCIITMPVKTEFIWNKYNVNWVQIDAPRHLIIHTLDSFELLLENTNLKIKKVVFDSDEFQFWGSEQYKKNIPLMADNSYLINPKKSIFTQKQINEFRKKSKKLNEQKIGDHALFILEGKK